MWACSKIVLRCSRGNQSFELLRATAEEPNQKARLEMGPATL